jgi:N-acetylglucosamine kinase-like BadF-type ATPase
VSRRTPWVDLAVDGGQTSLRLALVVGGVPVETAEAPGFHYRPTSDASNASLAAIVEAYAHLEVDRPPRRVCLGLTGAPQETARRRQLARAVLDALDATEVWLGPDMVTAHAGALPDGHGVVIAVGTGAVCLGLGAYGRAQRADGNGHLLGDHGSGFAIGRDALRAALLALEDRGPATTLAKAAAEHYADLSAFPQGIYTAANPVSAVASFTRAAAEAARAGDEVAIGIWRDAVNSVVTTTASVVRRCFPNAGQREVPVSYTGRMFEVRDLFLTPFRRRLALRCPAADIRPPLGGPLDGAARLVSNGVGPYRELMEIVRRSDR